jgi:hypothetical protein
MGLSGLQHRREPSDKLYFPGFAPENSVFDGEANAGTRVA